MKLFQTALFASVFPALALATPVAFYDPYYCGNGIGANGAHCTTNVQPSGSNDVIGNFTGFDIQKLIIMQNTANALQVVIHFNYGGTGRNGYNTNPAKSNFNAFTSGGLNLQVGDILFDLGGDGSFDFAAVMQGHGSTPGSLAPLATGGFYSINSTLTAFQIHNSTKLSSYRPNSEVWADPTGATLVVAGTRAVGRINNDANYTATALQTEHVATYSAAFAGNNPLFNKSFAIQFASATCGNDIVYGAVPEPATIGLAGSALAAIALLTRRRR
jgi:hypothetical protein